MSVKLDKKALDDFIADLKKTRDNLDDFYDFALRQVAARFLGEVIPLTPVRENKGKIRGGTLRRGWVALEGPGSMPSASDINKHVETLRTTTAGNLHTITLANSTFYSVFVNYGHLTPDGEGWVRGIHFKEEAEKQLTPKLPRVYSNLFTQWKQQQ